jgi:histidine triad (HIT) family protein
MSTSYDNTNIFARILRGELPCTKVYEDDDVLAFMDIMPRSEGHTLVISKTPARTLIDIEPQALSKLILATQKIAKAAQIAMKADGITIHQFNESAGGQVVFHIHFHVIPRFEGVALRPHTGDMANMDVLVGFAERIRAELYAGQ